MYTIFYLFYYFAANAAIVKAKLFHLMGTVEVTPIENNFVFHQRSYFFKIRYIIFGITDSFQVDSFGFTVN